MSLQGKPLEEITEADLRALVDNQARESQTLEYKRDPYGRGDEEVREMLRDISSMANAFGGDLLIGVDENEEGVALDLPGIENAEVEAQRMVSSSLDNIEERLFGLRAWPVQLQNGRFVVIVRIPRSLRAPHMVTFKGLNQCWARHDRQKSRMSVREIRDSCLRIEGLMEKLERFLEKRRREILEEIATEPYYVVSVTPTFVETEIVDIHDRNLMQLLENPPDQRPRGWNVRFERAPICPTIRGLARGDLGWKRLELFHNGHLELLVGIGDPPFRLYRARFGEEEHHVLSAFPLCEFPFSLLRLGKAVYDHLGVNDTIAFSLSLFNISGFALAEGAHEGHWTMVVPGFGPRLWTKQHLEVPPRRFQSLNEPGKVTKECVDRIWQAFGYMQAPLFDTHGNFRPE